LREPKLSGGSIEDSKDFFSELSNKVNVHDFFLWHSNITSWYNNGYIGVDFLTHCKIPLPKQYMIQRKSLFEKAKDGTVKDIIKYEESYKPTDANMTTLNPRKMNMLYSTKFFDTETETYKQNLYEKEVTAIKNKINSLLSKIKEQQSIAISEAEAKDFKTVVNRFANYSRYGYDPKNTASYVQQALTLSAVIDEITRQLSPTYIESYGMQILLVALYQERMTVNLDKAKEEQSIIVNTMQKANDLYRQNAFGEKEVFMKIYTFLSEKEGKLIQTANKNVATYNKHIAELNQRRGNKETMRKTMCPKCEIDSDKSTEYKTGSVFTLEKPGKIVMKTGDVTEFYKSGKIWTLRDGFLGIGDTTFDSYNEMLNFFLKKCKEKYFCD
jgi:hypothetical protein